MPTSEERKLNIYGICHDVIGNNLLIFVSFGATVMILSFLINRPGQTAQTQIRLLLVSKFLEALWYFDKTPSSYILVMLLFLFHAFE